LLYDDDTNKTVIGDFYAPFFCCPDKNTVTGVKEVAVPKEVKNKIETVADEKTNEAAWKKILERIGTAATKDDLKEIKGIGEKTEDLLNDAGIQSYDQMSKLKPEDIPALAIKMGVKDFVVKEDWFKGAQKLLSNK
jgi:large subunit ribosomal protein L21